MTNLFSEDDWQALTLLDQEKDQQVRKPIKWGAFPVSPHPDRIFFYPDLHFPFQDKLFLAYLDAKCDEFKPNFIIIMGDILDAYSMSSFDKDPSRRESLNDERIAAVEWLRDLRERHPDAIIIFVEGNHEERIRRKIIQKAPGLHDLPELTIPALLRFHELRIRHYNSHGFNGWGMRIKHGLSTAKYAANVELMKHWCDGVSAHTHRKAEVPFTTAEGVDYTWRSLGHCCDMDQIDYVKGPNWQQASGHLLAYPDGRRDWTWLEG
jgi:hypothetical protein